MNKYKLYTFYLPIPAIHWCSQWPWWSCFSVISHIATQWDARFVGKPVLSMEVIGQLSTFKWWRLWGYHGHQLPTPSAFTALGVPALVLSDPLHLKSKHEGQSKCSSPILIPIGVHVHCRGGGRGRGFPPGSNKYFLATNGNVQIYKHRIMTHHTLITSSYALSPWIWWANCISFGIMVTLFAWIAHRLVSSKRPIR